MRVGFIGWRGMVGSVLMERMREEGDFEELEPIFFSTSQVGHPPPRVGVDAPPLADAYDVELLKSLNVVISCQGSDYTKQIYPELRSRGFHGCWIDAASALRMQDEALIILDPVNRHFIKDALASGGKTFIGGNCTVSLMLMAFHGLFSHGWVEWMTSMTYQAASGAGARNMRELVAQIHTIGAATQELLDDPAAAILELDAVVTRALGSESLPTACFRVPLAGSLIPWIDAPMAGGQTREEWKGFSEANKILNQKTPIPIDGICVRIGSMRCHSQAVTIKLTQDVPLDEIESAIAEANAWVKVVPNAQNETITQLSPAAVSGTLTVPVGRMHKLLMGPEYLTAFTVGDQLLWGAAEPLRRMLAILRER